MLIYWKVTTKITKTYYFQVIEAAKMMLQWDLTKEESISWNWINIGNETNHIMRFHREIIRFKLAQFVDISRSWMIMMI